MEISTLISREELGDMYYKLKDEYDRYFSPWSNWLAPKGNPETVKKDLLKKIAAIEKELGADFLLVIRQKKEIRSLETHLKDQCKNNDELELRIERLEACVRELYSGKKNQRHAYFPNCESAIPSKMNVASNSYPSLI